MLITKICLSCGNVFSKQFKYDAKYCNKQCYYDSLKGVSNHWLGKKRLSTTGEMNPLWRGGITKLQDQVRTCLEMKLWKRKILIRDNFNCIFGGKEHGNKLAVDHHPIQFAQALVDNQITTLDEAIKCTQLWDINNGRTLCIPCHKKTDTYLKRLKN